MSYFAVVLRVWRVLQTRVQELYEYTYVKVGGGVPFLFHCCCVRR